jgi:hypothetical protein
MRLLQPLQALFLSTQFQAHAAGYDTRLCNVALSPADATRALLQFNQFQADIHRHFHLTHLHEGENVSS